MTLAKETTGRWTPTAKKCLTMVTLGKFPALSELEAASCFV